MPQCQSKEYLSHGIGRSFQVPEILGGIASPNSNLPLRAFGFEYGTMLIDRRFAVTATCVAFVAATLWAALGIDSLARPIQESRRDLVVLLPFFLTTLVLWFIGQVQSPRGDRLERLTFWALIIASGLTILGGIGNVRHSALLEHLGFPAGPLLWTVGLIVYGIASWRTRIFPRYVAVTLILFEPASILTGVALSSIAPLRDSGSYTGGVEKAVAVMILGFAIRQLAPSPQLASPE